MGAADEQDGQASASPRVCVLVATPLLTVTIEPTADETGAELHLHAGGQGVWLGRMARSLGAEVTVCGPFGGETGRLAALLAEDEGLSVRATPHRGSTGSYVHDRRDGERTEIIRIPAPPLGRHEVDDLYGAIRVEALDADVVVLGGAEPAGVVPAEFYVRLTADLRASGCTVVADLSGEAALAVLGPGVDVLKMSHTEMRDADLSDGDDEAALVGGARRIVSRGTGAVVVSRAADPTLLVTPDGARSVTTPPVTAVDHHGGGDSMTAGIAVGLARRLDLSEAVRLGAAAAALNVARRGLGSGRQAQIERFAAEVSLHPIADGDDGDSRNDRNREDDRDRGSDAEEGRDGRDG